MSESCNKSHNNILASVYYWQCSKWPLTCVRRFYTVKTFLQLRSKFCRIWYLVILKEIACHHSRRGVLTFLAWRLQPKQQDASTLFCCEALEMFSALQNFPLKRLLYVNVLRISVKVGAQWPHYHFWVNLSFNKLCLLTFDHWLFSILTLVHLL